MNIRKAFAAAVIGSVIALGSMGVASAEELPTEPVATQEATPETIPAETPAEETPEAPVAEEVTPEAEAPAPVAEEPVAEPAAEVPAARTPEATPFQPYTESNSWTLPKEWNDPLVTPSYSEAIYNQTLGSSCGVWNQNDVYHINTQAEADLYASIIADGVLTYGEDGSLYLSHTYTFEPCAPGPANPAGSVTAVCGVATLEASNAGENILTTTFVVYVNGEFEEVVALAAGETWNTVYEFAEDTGTNSVELRTGPAQGDILIGAVKVETNCIVPPVTPEEPPVTPETPVVAPPAAAPVAVTVAEVPAAQEDTLAETGAETYGPMLVAGGLVAAGLALAFLGMFRRKEDA